jgi:predicted anti-sigma-YlaC factor YlaD
LLNCTKVLVEISNYLDGNLEEDLKRNIETHIRMCRHCKVVFDTTRKTIELYCDGKLFVLPEDVRARLHSSLRQKWQAKREGS